MKIRVLIADDEPLARDRLAELLSADEQVEVIGHCEDGPETVVAIEAGRPDLLFLDVQMPGLDGFEVLRTLPPEAVPATIFVTAYDQFALKAFEVHALDYLLKPFDRERFRQALDRGLSECARRRAGGVDSRLLSLLEELSQARGSSRDRLVVKGAGRVVFLKLDEIDWIEAAGNYVHLHSGSERHLHRETMADLACRLAPDRFLRIHRSTIVNIDRIRRLVGSPGGDVTLVLRDGTQLPVGRTYRQKLEERFDISL